MGFDHYFRFNAALKGLHHVTPIPSHHHQFSQEPNISCHRFSPPPPTTSHAMEFSSPWLKATSVNNNQFGAKSSQQDYGFTEINLPSTSNKWNRPVPPIPSEEQLNRPDGRRPRSSSPQQHFMGSDYQNSSVLLKLDLEKGSTQNQEPRLKRLSIEIDDVPQAPPRITSLQSPVMPFRLPPLELNSSGLLHTPEASSIGASLTKLVPCVVILI